MSAARNVVTSHDFSSGMTVRDMQEFLEAATDGAYSADGDSRLYVQSDDDGWVIRAWVELN